MDPYSDPSLGYVLHLLHLLKWVLRQKKSVLVIGYVFFENTILNFLNKVIFGIQRNSFGTWNMFEKHIPKYLIYLSATSFPDRGQFFSEKTFVYEKVIFTT